MKKLVTIILLAGLVSSILPDTASAAPRRPRIGARVGIEIAVPGAHFRSFGPRYPIRYPRRVWVPGRYEWQVREQVVPGHWVTVREAPVYRTVHGYDGARRVVLSERGARRVWRPERIEFIRVRVWIPGHWESRIR
jgi:hypothetical protein